jgi:thioredoxin-dependent peroxiredoxin
VLRLRSSYLYENVNFVVDVANQITALALTGLVVFATGAWAQELKIGDVAPDFTLQASDGQTYTLSKLKGKTVVLAWFPKAFTGG